MPNNPAHAALSRAVNRAIAEGAPIYTEISALPAAALDMIPDSARWAIANALRSAADKWGNSHDGFAATVADPRVAEQFKRQAAEALAYAEQFENC